MAVTATLKIQLLANDVLVAQSEDPALWQQVLSAMNGAGSLTIPERQPVTGQLEIRPNTGQSKGLRGIEGFAGELGLDTTIVTGACEPSSEAPFIHLDGHCWESFKRNTPARGTTAISAINLAGTLLCLWFKHAGIEGKPTPAQAKAVLATIGVVENNPSRAVNNCEWLQARGGGIQINPARMSRAVAIARAYCSQQPVD